MLKLESLLQQSQAFLKKTKVVAITQKNIGTLADFIKTPLTLAGIEDFAGQAPLFFLLIDGLNFCFWHPDAHKKFAYYNNSGSVALGYGIKDALKNNPEIFEPDHLIKNAPTVFKTIIKNADGELLLPQERVKILREIGQFLKKCDLKKVIAKFQSQDIDKIARFIAKNLPYTFKDEQTKFGITIPFYKKLRLLLSDWMMLSGLKFKNLDKLLVYADYKLPQVFLNYGVIKIPEKYLAQLKNHEIVPKNSELEIGLRAASVVASSYLKGLTNFSYPELDFQLWLCSRKLPADAIPYHRTLNRFY